MGCPGSQAKRFFCGLSSDAAGQEKKSGKTLIFFLTNVKNRVYD